MSWGSKVKCSTSSSMSQVRFIVLRVSISVSVGYQLLLAARACL